MKLIQNTLYFKVKEDLVARAQLERAFKKTDFYKLLIACLDKLESWLK